MLELLEGRELPSTVTWTNASGGDWDTASNWSTGAVPTAANNVQINISAITITHAQGNADVVHSLSSKAAINISSGSLSLAATSTISAGLTLSATLTGAGALTIGGLFTWTDGTLSGSGQTFANGGININGKFGETLDGRTLNSAWKGHLERLKQHLL